MENKEKIKKILDDLYMIDEDLKKHEKELFKLADQLIKAKPNTKFDQDFKENLKVELLKQAEDIMNNKKSSFSEYFAFKNLAWLGVGAVISAVIIVPIISSQNNKFSSDNSTKLAYTSKIEMLEDNAFGILNNGETGPSSVNKEMAMSSGIGAGGGGMDTLSAQSAVPEMAVAPMPVDEDDGAMARTTKMIAPQNIITYEYVYKGDEFSIDKEKMLVYKKVKDVDLSKNMANNISVNGFGLLDLNQFKNTQIGNINFSEDREFGYSIYMNFFEGEISINKNWEQWPQFGRDCRDKECYDKYRLKIGDILENEEVIKIADKFISDYEISKENYGEAQVRNEWKQRYEMSEDKSTYYVPESLQVVYPLKIEDKEVFDDNGNPVGMTIDVDIRNKKVSNAYGIKINNYTASNYAIENNQNIVKDLAEKGGLYGGYQYPNPTKVVEIQLGTPELKLVKHWQYNRESGNGEELIVPSYVFPVIGKSDDVYFYRKAVVVPLVKEILESIKNDSDGVVPMPLLERVDVMDEDVPVMIKESVR